MIHLINDLCGYRLLLIRLSAAAFALSLPLFSALHRAWQNRVPSSFFSSLYLSLLCLSFLGAVQWLGEECERRGSTALLIGLIFSACTEPDTRLLRAAVSPSLSPISLSALALSRSLSINKRVIIAPVKGMVMRAVVMVIGGGGCVFITDLSYWGKKAVIEPWLRHIRSPPSHINMGPVETLGTEQKCLWGGKRHQARAKVLNDST